MSRRLGCGTRFYWMAFSFRTVLNNVAIARECVLRIDWLVHLQFSVWRFQKVRPVAKWRLGLWIRLWLVFPANSCFGVIAFLLLLFMGVLIWCVWVGLSVCLWSSVCLLLWAKHPPAVDLSPAACKTHKQTQKPWEKSKESNRKESVRLWKSPPLAES